MPAIVCSDLAPGASPASRDRGGGGGKIKIRGGKLFHSFWIGLRRSFSENQVPKSEGFSGQNQVISKKKVYSEIGRLFLAEIANSNVFSGRDQQVFPPQKIPWWQEINRGGKNENRGGIAPRWRRACLALKHPKNMKLFLWEIQRILRLNYFWKNCRKVCTYWEKLIYRSYKWNWYIHGQIY